MPRKTRKLSLEQLRHLAKAGAEATLHRLRAEIEVLERTFPELASSRGRQADRHRDPAARRPDERGGPQGGVRPHEKVTGRNAARRRANDARAGLASSLISLL